MATGSRFTAGESGGGTAGSTGTNSFLENLFGGGQFTGFGGGGSTPVQKGASIFGNPITGGGSGGTGIFGTAASRSNSPLGKAMGGKGGGAALGIIGLIMDAVKRREQDKVNATIAATAPFTGGNAAQLAGLSQSGSLGFDPVGQIAEQRAAGKAIDERDRLLSLFEKRAGKVSKEEKEFDTLKKRLSALESKGK